MSAQTMLWDSSEYIVLPGSPAGSLPSSLPDGEMNRSGPDLAPANPSPSLVGGRGSKMSGIYGPTSIGSSVPPGPLSSWESKLRRNLGTIGSTEWPLIWKRKATKQGRSISRLRVSTPRTSETGCTGWRSPNVREKGGGAYSDPAKALARLTSGHQINLEDEALAIAGWSTPRATDGEKGGPNMSFGAGGTPLPAQASQLAGWVTPDARDANAEGLQAGLSQIEKYSTCGLQTQAVIAGWNTPKASQTMGRYSQVNGKRYPGLWQKAQFLSGATTNSWDPTRKDSIGALGQLNPAFVSWLMGFPPEWLEHCPAKRSRSLRKVKRGASPSSKA
jgi:hypothetical protein